MKSECEPNFKPSKAEQKKRARARKRKRRAERPGNSLDHLANIRRLPCIVTGKTAGTQVHHLKCCGGRGLALTAPDRYGVPLSPKAHLFGVEPMGSGNELDWFGEQGIEPIALANDLWAATGDLNAMREAWNVHWFLKPIKQAEYMNQFYG